MNVCTAGGGEMHLINGEHVTVWGDSLGKGVVWNETRARYGYVEETAADIVQQKLGCTVDNRSKFGCTAPMGMKLIERDLAGRVTCDAALIEYGGNDCNFDWASIAAAPEGEHLPATSPDVFAQTIRCMVARIRQADIRPILMTLPPIHPERYFHFFVGDKLNGDNVLRWLGDVWQIYRYQELYSLMIADIARDMQVQLFDLRARCLAERDFIRRCLCEDGLHMNAAGQRFVGEQMCALALAANK